MKKNIYFVQANSVYGGEVALPYAPGSIAAVAFSDSRIADEYSLSGFFYKKEDFGLIIEKLENPYIVGFSCYICNFNYSKLLAEEIKRIFPSCLIVFGGHCVNDNSPELLEECPFIDFLIHAEGEIPFKKLLEALSGTIELSEVPNLSYRNNGCIFKNENRIFDVTDFPSPYEMGLFDSLLDSGDKFYAVFETNRGCPFNCLYCDWGNHNAKVRFFPKKRIKAEFDWFSDKKIGYLICADANFGMFERDVAITEYIISKKQQNGYPGRIQFCFTKNSDDRVFILNKMMNDSALSKGATISLQTFSEKALLGAGRKNMSFDSYKTLVRKYNSAGISAYTDMILGLPGETYESFKNGLSLLLDAGQHTGVNVFNCEMLVNSGFGQQETIKKYGIKTAPCAINRHHAAIGNGIQEDNRVIIATSSMPPEDWVKANLFVAVLGCMHNLGFLRFMAMYSVCSGISSYNSFYSAVLDFVLNDSNGICNKVFSELKKKLDDVINGKDICECPLELFGNVNWPAEEWCFLQIQEENESVYEDLEPLMRSLTGFPVFFDELYSYQKNMVKFRCKEHYFGTFDYDFPSFFNSFVSTQQATLIPRKTTIEITDRNPKKNPVEYARETVWYGRKGGTNIYTSELHVSYPEENK